MMIYPTPRPGLRTAIAIQQAAFPGIAVSHEMPKTRPAQFVRVMRVPGGGYDNPRFDRVRLLVEYWAKSIGVVEGMFNTGREAFMNSSGTSVVLGAGLDPVFIYGWTDGGGGDYSDPDVPDMLKWQLFGELSVSTR